MRCAKVKRAIRRISKLSVARNACGGEARTRVRGTLLNANHYANKGKCAEATRWAVAAIRISTGLTTGRCPSRR